MDVATTTISLGIAVVLNMVDGNGTIWRINKDGFTGWGSPAPKWNPIPRVRQRGSTAGASFDSARVMSITGTITAQTPTALNTAIDLLLSTVTREEFLVTVTESGRPRFTTSRRAGETLVPKITNLIASYSIQLESMDPRKFSSPLTASTGLPVASGGFVVPETWPLVVAGGTVSGSVSFVNTGTETGPVVVRVDGPCAPFNVAHTSPAGVSTFSTSLVLNVGEFVLIDMEAKTMLGNGQSSRSVFITSRAWSNFDGGNNTWTFTAASYNAASLMTITATPAN